MSEREENDPNKVKSREAVLRHAETTGAPALRRAVYVWQLPIRLFHWIGFFAIIGLIITGLYIANPAVMPMGEATTRFMMGSMRYWHAIFAYIFTANMIFRLYWFWAGNQYAKFPFWRKDYWQDLVYCIRYYLFMARKEHVVHVGHNSLAQLSYIIFVWGGGLVMILTGFAMRGGSDPNGLWQSLFGWVVPLLGGEYQVRNIHHLITWFFIMFIVFHLYLAFRQDTLDDDSSVSSIITGYKYELESTVDHHLQDKYEKRGPKERKNAEGETKPVGEAMPGPVK